VIGLSQQQHPRITGQAILPAANLHGAIERRLKQRLLAFTHKMPPFDFSGSHENP
jgi:hypothetical protein